MGEIGLVMVKDMRDHPIAEKVDKLHIGVVIAPRGQTNRNPIQLAPQSPVFPLMFRSEWEADLLEERLLLGEMSVRIVDRLGDRVLEDPLGGTIGTGGKQDVEQMNQSPMIGIDRFHAHTVLG
jgi:hypothetical protein